MRLGFSAFDHLYKAGEGEGLQQIVYRPVFIGVPGESFVGGAQDDLNVWVQLRQYIQPRKGLHLHIQEQDRNGAQFPEFPQSFQRVDGVTCQNQIGNPLDERFDDLNVLGIVVDNVTVEVFHDMVFDVWGGPSRLFPLRVIDVQVRVKKATF